MGNRVVDVDNRVQSVELPEPGDVVLASQWRALIGTYNAALSEVGANVLISQEWPDSNASHAGSIPQLESEDVPLCSWLIPITSTSHDVLHVSVRAWNSLGLLHDGRIILRSRVAGDEVSLTVGAGLAAAEDWDDLDPLDIGGIDVTAGSDDAVDHAEVVDLFIETDDPSATVTLLQLTGEVRDLVDAAGLSDLDAVAVSTSDVTAYPLGIQMAADERPLSTPIGLTLIEGDAHLRQRATLAVTWSGLDPAYDGPDPDDRWAPPHGVITAHRPDGNGDRRRYARVDGTGGEIEHVDTAPSDLGSALRLSNAAPGGAFTPVGGGDGAPRPRVVADIAPGFDMDSIERAGVARAQQHYDGVPHYAVVGDEDPIRLAAYSAWTRQPTSDAVPNPLAESQVLFAQSVRGEQLARLSAQMVHHWIRRSPRQIHHVVNYASASGAVELDRPAPIDVTHRIPWTPSPGALGVLLWLRYQASDLSETLPSIDVELSSDGDAVDGAAFTLSNTNGLSYDGAVTDTNRWAIREFLTPIRGGLADGDPGALLYDGEAGPMEIELACINVRLISASVLEIPRNVPIRGS